MSLPSSRTFEPTRCDLDAEQFTTQYAYD